MEYVFKVGQAVVYVDPRGVRHDAILTAVWDSGPTPSVNLVYVSDDPARNDTYGRQIERSTSVVNQSLQSAHGNYWAQK